MFFLPGSSTGAMTSIINSILGEKNYVNSLRLLGLLWYQELKKLKFKVNCKKDLSGKLPFLSDIPINSDVLFVWNATSNGMSISNINFLPKS